ncbi:MAG: hypothetical protein VKM97_01820 [Cyanobacteriota bacterium]|nr:hypothetical protein [Cyanobacteriota bacterium]
MSRPPWRPGPGDEPWPDLCRIEPLAGWHLPLLGDPAFLPLHPLLQRALLLALPERILQTIARRPSLAPQVLVAFAPRSQDALGLIVTRRLNRSGSCWQLQHLRTTPSADRRRLGGALLRSAISRARGARSWIAQGSSLDPDRLALLREQGFQPLRTDQLWCWQPPSESPPPAPALPADLRLQPLTSRNAALLWHLEQGACPAQLRQLLDRRVEDLLDQSHGRGWLLVDSSRAVAVAAARWVGEHAGGGHDLEFTLQEGWQHLLGGTAELLLQRAAQALGGDGLWLRCDVRDQARQSWLERLGAVQRGERVLMARSVWGRPAPPLAVRSTSRIDAVLEQLQPRRRPLPTPVAHPCPVAHPSPVAHP